MFLTRKYKNLLKEIKTICAQNTQTLHVLAEREMLPQHNGLNLDSNLLAEIYTKICEESKYNALYSHINALRNEERIENDKILLLQGKLHSEINKKKNSANLQDYEFKVFSQFNEDGIIQRLIDCVEIKNKTFIEFGVESFMEANCRFLLQNDNWNGFIIDGSEHNINLLKSSYFYWTHELRAETEFVTTDNINTILSRSCFDSEVGILSIDIDGNDYYILENIEYFRPCIIICEYNPLFGDERAISTPYEPKFDRMKAHYSGLFWGASLAAFEYLASQKGYSLVGTESHGINAFFVRNDLLSDKIMKLSVKEAFTMAKVRQNRDPNGFALHTSLSRSYPIIEGLPVYNVISKKLEFF